jgi:DHA3 family tetracycline resistance protein-like MFS transporter
LLDNFSLPVWFGNNEVAFFAALEIVGTLLTILIVNLVEKRVDTSSPLSVGRAMLVVTAGIALAMVGFAHIPYLLLALGFYLIIDVLRSIRNPLQTAWINQKLDSKVRATVHSMFGQVDAIGQIAGGPGVGLIANLVSVAAAVTTSGLLLTPALFLIRRANHRSLVEEDVSSTAIEPEIVD